MASLRSSERARECLSREAAVCEREEQAAEQALLRQRAAGLQDELRKKEAAMHRLQTELQDASRLVRSMQHPPELAGPTGKHQSHSTPPAGPQAHSAASARWLFLLTRRWARSSFLVPMTHKLTDPEGEVWLPPHSFAYVPALAQ